MKINIKLCLWNCPRSLGSLFDLLHKLHHAFFIPLLWSLGLCEISKQFRTILQQKRCAHIGIFCLVCFIRWTYFGIPQFPDHIICHLIHRVRICPQKFDYTLSPEVIHALFYLLS